MLTLDEVKKRCEPVFAARPIERAWVFGSYSRGEQDEDSDVDICYDLVEGSTLKIEDGVMFGAFRGVQQFQVDLEGALGLEVDVLRRPRESEYGSRVFFDEVERDRWLIYERAAV